MIRAHVRMRAPLSAVLATAGCTLIGGPGTVVPTAPPGLDAIGDPVPYDQPPSPRGNPAEYEQSGRTYRVLDNSFGYDERGMASWYGEEFNGRPTSSGESFDMYALTGAHRTLPIPTYVRVTNLTNGGNSRRHGGSISHIRAVPSPSRFSVKISLNLDPP